MINLCAILPDGRDPTSFYRGMGPLGALREIVPNLLISEQRGFDWRTIKMFDVFFMQRPHTEGHIKLARMIKQQHKPLWIDFDDDLFNVPTGNPNYDFYKDCHKVISELRYAADIVTVSTNHMAETTFPNAVVIPNAFDDYLFSFKTKENQSKSVRWRGSHCHEKDLMLVEKDTLCLARSFPDWKWKFWGANPWYLSDEIKNHEYKASIDIIDYFEALAKDDSSIAMVPLVDSSFNRSKSNIAWMEATYSGAVTFASNLPEFRQPGVVLADDLHWERDLHHLMTNITPEFIDRHVRSSTEFINDVLLLSKINLLRRDVLEALISG